MLHKEIPFLRICVPLCSGVITGIYTGSDHLLPAIIISLAAVAFILSIVLRKYNDDHIFGIAVFLSFFITGWILCRIQKDSLSVLKKETSVFTCTLTDFPEEKEKNYTLILKIDAIIENSIRKPLNVSIILYNKKDSIIRSFLPGDQLIIRCSPEEISNRGNPNEFDYKTYMENAGIKYRAFTSTRDILYHSSPEKRNLKHHALIIREKIIQMYRDRGITGERLALISALILGEKSMLDQEQKDVFIRAGVMHIMAVSGLHAMILSMFVMSIFFFLKGRLNILRILIAVLFLWAFAFVTGLTPSVLRATIMFTFIQVGNIMKRKVNSVNSVLASAFVLIVAKPTVILDAGFLLSYSAVIYIILFYSDLYNKLKSKNIALDKIWQSCAVTLVAQAGTLPLTVMLFNRFPVYFILTNLIIVPLSSLVIIVGCIMPLLYPFVKLSTITGIILGNLTELTEYLTEKAANLPMSNIEDIGITVPECIVMIMMVFIITRFLTGKRKMSLFYPALSILAFILVSAITDIRVRNTNEIIVYNIPGSFATGIRTGKLMNVYSGIIPVGQDIRRQCSVLGIKIKAVKTENEFCLIKAGKRKILICNSGLKEKIKLTHPDIVVYNGNMKETEGVELNKSVYYVFSSGISSVKNNTEKRNVHYTKKDGAFISAI